MSTIQFLAILLRAVLIISQYCSSFFRQLDHIIATLMNEEFSKLYAWASNQMANENSTTPSAEIVQEYSEYKAAIFSRYRTLSELMGAILLKQAQKVNLNCLMETSGKDVAMFHYIDHFVPVIYRLVHTDGQGVRGCGV